VSSLDLPRPDLSIFDTGSHDVERCGVIIVTNGTPSVVEVPNHSPDPRNAFVISKKDVPKERVIGIVHTHLKEQQRTPSGFDIQYIPEGLIGMVYHPNTKSVTWYASTGILHKELRKRHT